MCTRWQCQEPVAHPALHLTDSLSWNPLLGSIWCMIVLLTDHVALTARYSAPLAPQPHLALSGWGAWLLPLLLGGASLQAANNLSWHYKNHSVGSGTKQALRCWSAASASTKAHAAPEECHPAKGGGGQRDKRLSHLQYTFAGPECGIGF